MADMRGDIRIAFNGEIYNFRELRDQLVAAGHSFRSGTDTEVILEAYRAWGTRCVERFNGMFAFAIHDGPRQRIFLARDRAGEKPLFYAHRRSRLAFASELKALLGDSTVERILDPRAVDHYFAFGYVPGEQCILRGVRKLPQGSALTYDILTDHLHAWTYWRLPDPVSVTAPACEESLLEELETLLEDSVRQCLVADVTVGVLLSGGVDSSLITAMAARVSSAPIKTFTITFPGHGTFNEAPYARFVAQRFGTEHHELAAEPPTADLVVRLASQFDEPIADSSMVPTYLVSRLVRRHAGVALGGDGGDELFGGYPHYSWLVWQDRVARWVPGPIRRALSFMAPALPAGTRGRNHLIGLGDGLPRANAHINLYFDGFTRRRLLAPMLRQCVNGWQSPEASKAALFDRNLAPVQAASRVDFRTYLVDDILVKVDRSSMLASLEMRAPFLDPRLIEFAFGRVPDELRANGTARRVLTRHLARRLIGPGFDADRKQGFSLPLDQWFRGEWRDFLQSTLEDASPELFDHRVIDQLFHAQRAGFRNSQRLFALAMFELWRREYRVQVAA